jgi:hypothetical protein
MPLSLTPEQRKLRARIAAHTRWAKEDPVPGAIRGQAGLIEKFRREVLAADPAVTDPELTRRAESLRSAHMARLAIASSRARARKTPGR